MKKRRSRRERIAQKAAGLAPPEEQPGHARGEIHKDTQTPVGDGNGNGSILVNTGKLNLPKNLIGDEAQERGRLFGLEPVMLTILLLCLAFIGFIAYLISRTG
ncbi:MAG TPA: hypothetical protein VNA19_00705 [Pyrinomonadaceae bacterium]|nr:hypothetical protein [Pyrinomonadaceae bacterium]